MYKELFFPDKQKIQTQDIEAFIKEQHEESSNLDYKSGLGFSRDKKSFFNKLAVHIAAMANAQGGLIIVGVDEKGEEDSRGNIVRLVPDKISYVSGVTKEDIEVALNQRIKPHLPGLSIIPVVDNSGAIYLIDVPQGSNPPYRSNNGIKDAGKDDRYPVRSNFGIRELEHYEIEDMFYRRKRPDLKLHIKIINNGPDLFTLVFSLKNDGKSIAKHTLLMISLPPTVQIDNVKYLRNESDINPEKKVYTHKTNDDVIYPSGPRLHCGQIVMKKNQPAFEMEMLFVGEDSTLRSEKVEIKPISINEDSNSLL